MRGYRRTYKSYSITFKYLGQDITASCRVEADGIDHQDRYYASQCLLGWLRELGLFRNSCIHSKDLVEIPRKEMTPWKDTIAQIKQAEENFKNQPMSPNKLVMAMANANGVTI